MYATLSISIYLLPLDEEGLSCYRFSVCCHFKAWCLNLVRPRRSTIRLTRCRDAFVAATECALTAAARSSPPAKCTPPLQTPKTAASTEKTHSLLCVSTASASKSPAKRSSSHQIADANAWRSSLETYIMERSMSTASFTLRVVFEEYVV
ncbi:hypothetical protein VTL71DRAFT_6954 [Oculimacula yallundae]|uniref:Uncharacterized protein n=1 Tax=Oculimacula yallundae TaxID=86028 RepID=A0ABR4BW50_9HELO